MVNTTVSKYCVSQKKRTPKNTDKLDAIHFKQSSHVYISNYHIVYLSLAKDRNDFH